MAKMELGDEVVRSFLAPRFGDVSGLELLKGGAWSAAYAFTADGRQLVVKFGHHRDDYERDALAGTWSLPDAPTPEVLELGDAFDGCYAVQPRMEGHRFDELPPERFDVALDAVLRAYEALATVTLPGSGFGSWTGPSGDAPMATWAEHLTSVPRRDDDRLRGWRERLHAHSDAQAAFDASQALLERLVANCPEDRAVSHGDPLWGNILIADDGSVAAMLDWGVSTVGDPLFDLAMLIFCEPWHAGIDTDRVWASAVRRAGTRDVDERLRACMLHIGLAALQYQAFASRAEDLDKTSAFMRTTLLA